VRRAIVSGIVFLLVNLAFLALPTSEAAPMREGLFLWDVSQPRDCGSLVEACPPFRLDEPGSATVYVTAKPNNQQGILYMVNVSVFFESSRIATGVSNSSGVAVFFDIPYGNVTFVAYAKSDYSQEIGNLTKHISSENAEFNLACDQNYAETSQNWEIKVVVFSFSDFIIVSTLLATGPQHRPETKRGTGIPLPLKGS
jgi:hypothetical protein